MEVWDARNGDIIMLGSLQPWRTGPEVFQQGFAVNRVRTDMAMININSPEALLGRQLASQRTGFAIAGDGPLQSDMHPILEYAAPQAFFMGDGTRMLDRYDERTWQQLLAPPEKTLALRSLSPQNAQYLFSDFSTINGELYGCLLGYPSSANIPCAFNTPHPAPPPGSGGTDMDQVEVSFANGNLAQASQILSVTLNRNPADEQALYLERVVRRALQMRGQPSFH
jgi:hypothetical protein